MRVLPMLPNSGCRRYLWLRLGKQKTAFLLNYSEFPNSCFRRKFSIAEYLTDMFIDC